LSNSATIIGTPGLSVRLSTEESTHAVSVSKPKKIGDTSLAARGQKVKKDMLMDINRERNPAPLTKHTRINQPAFTLPNFSQSNQESPPSSIQRTKLHQVDEHLKGSPVTQVAEIHHHACLLKTAELTSP
jgi:hypothetical protein